MLKSAVNRGDVSRQPVKGIFFCKDSVPLAECRKLVEDLGCTILVESPDRLTIKTTRARLQQLKEHYLATEDDKAGISGRLKEHFRRILIGGSSN